VSAIFDRFAHETFDVAYYPDPKDGPEFRELISLINRCRLRSLLYIGKFCSFAPRYRLEVGWLFDGELNACAGIEKISNCDCIGINIGTVHLLRTLFNRMLAHREVLAFVGNSYFEHKPSYTLTPTKLHLKDFDQRTIPNDGIRIGYSNYLFYCAFNFLFQHEFGHLFHGHSDLLLQRFGFRVLDERGRSTLTALTPLDKQTLEMDADSFAINDVLTQIPANKSRHSSFFAAIFAVYCLFRLFGSENIADDDALLAEEHPPAVYRQRFILGAILEYVQDTKLMPLPTFADVIAGVIEEAEIAFAVLTGSSPLAAPQINESFERIGKVLSKLLANWKVLRPELERLKRGGELVMVP
jgi:hypothetical protein